MALMTWELRDSACGLRIRFRGMKIGFSQKRVRGLLVDPRNRDQYRGPI